MKKITVGLCLLLASLGLSLVVSESLLKVFGFEPLVQTFSNSKDQQIVKRLGVPPEAFKAESMDEFLRMGFIKGEYGNRKADPDLGYTYFDEPHGFVDGKDFYKDWSAYKRVLVLGDSFTAGCCAPKGKGFVDLLSDYFDDKKVAIFNTGVGGYGQNNQLAVLKKYFKVLDPDLVLLCFYTGNDFADNSVPLDRFTAFPGYTVANYESYITVDGVSYRRRSREEIWGLYQEFIGNHDRKEKTLLERFKTKFFYKTRIGTLVWKFWKRVRFKANKRMHKYTGVVGRHPDYDYNMTKDYLKNIMDYLKERNTPIHVLVIPDNRESRDRMVRSEKYKRAIDLMHEVGAEYLDIFDKMTVLDYDEKRIFPDSHWNESGHRKAFEELRSYLEDRIK